MPRKRIACLVLALTLLLLGGCAPAVETAAETPALRNLFGGKDAETAETAETEDIGIPEGGAVDIALPEEPIAIEPGWDYYDRNIYHLTDEQAAKLLNLINSTTRLYSYDDEIMDIISDEAQAFFAGQKTSQQVADNIQSRVRLYVGERK